MKRTLSEHDAIRLGRYDAQSPGVTPIDRETLEGVMREDVFLATEGKEFGLDPIRSSMLTRRNLRRA